MGAVRDGARANRAAGRQPARRRPLLSRGRPRLGAARDAADRLDAAAGHAKWVSRETGLGFMARSRWQSQRQVRSFAPVSVLGCGMDPKTLHKHLAEAEAQVAQGLRHVADQRDVVEQLERDGHDSTTARDLLLTLLRSQQL